MKRRLIALLEIVRAELNEAIALVEADEVEDAIEKIRAIGARIRTFTTVKTELDAAREAVPISAESLTRNEPGGSREEASPGSSTNGG